MSAAEESLRMGDPERALAQLQDEVRRQPADGKLRLFLFQLLAVLGQWERAATQLQVASELDASALGMAALYREAMRCEALRAAVFAGDRSPLFLGEPAEWVALLVEALRLTAQDRHAEAQAVRARAFEVAPATPGQLDGTPFDWLADADPRLGPVLEGIVDGKYYWIPFQHIRRIAIEPPVDLRDLIWLPAFVTWANGGESPVLIPARYPGSEVAADPLLRLARRTEWSAVAPDLYLGLGQRMLATADGEFPILDVRTIELRTATDEPAS